MAITAPLFNTRVGRVLVVYGRAASRLHARPDTTRALEIRADPALARTQLGSALVGVGHFYSGTGTTLVVSATGLITQPSANEGRLYALRGCGPGAAIHVTSADHAYVGAATGTPIGSQLTNLGILSGTLASVGSSNLADAMTIPGRRHRLSSRARPRRARLQVGSLLTVRRRRYLGRCCSAAGSRGWTCPCL